MGTECAPSYAYIFMVKYEAKHIYPYIKEMSLLYLRYIDNIFMIWRYKSRLNDIQKRTKWKTQNYQTGLSNFTKKNCVFWRTDIKDENNIQTTLYRKPSDQQAFLYVISEHLRSLNSSIPCTEFGKQSVIIKQKFLHGHYEEELLDEQIKERR